MKKILITAGPTREFIDPVRYITNRSSGKMGYALAEAAISAKCTVTLISGPVNLPPPDNVKIINIVSAEDMCTAVKLHFAKADILIMSAAVADYAISEYSQHKIKKKNEDYFLHLKRTSDILLEVSKVKTKSQKIMGFAAESENLIENAKKKFIKKGLDWIVANNIASGNYGFESNKNKATLISHNSFIDFPLMTKKELAKNLIEIILK